MATNFPGSQDNFTNPTSSDTLDSPDHAAQHADVNDAVEALQAKVGVDSSAVTTSHDYKIAQLEANAVTDHGALTGLADDDHTQYLLADGTRTATELTVSGDVTVDTDTLHVDATNDRVGIGTSTPAEELDVVGDVQVSGRLGVGGGISAELDIKGASNPEIRLQSTDSSDPFLYFGDQVDAVRGGIGFDTSANNLLFRRYNNITAMTLTSGGYLGINDTTPSYQLDVNGDINSATEVRYKGEPLRLVHVAGLVGDNSVGGPNILTLTDCFTDEFKTYLFCLNNVRSFSSTVDQVRIKLQQNNGTYASGFSGGARGINYGGPFTVSVQYTGNSFCVGSTNVNMPMSSTMFIHNTRSTQAGRRLAVHGTSAYSSGVYFGFGKVAGTSNSAKIDDIEVVLNGGGNMRTYDIQMYGIVE